jgi:hypothetical protein
MIWTDIRVATNRWEWGVVIVSNILFMIFSELYKLLRRIYIDPIKPEITSMSWISKENICGMKKKWCNTKVKSRWVII